MASGYNLRAMPHDGKQAGRRVQPPGLSSHVAVITVLLPSEVKSALVSFKSCLLMQWKSLLHRTGRDNFLSCLALPSAERSLSNVGQHGPK